MNFWLISYIVVLFFLRLPPYYLPGTQNILLTTHSIAVLIIFVVMIKLFINLFKERLIFDKKYSVEISLILLFLFTQSISIFSAVNIYVFLQHYSKIIIGISIYFLVKYFLTKTKKDGMFLSAILYI